MIYEQGEYSSSESVLSDSDISDSVSDVPPCGVEEEAEEEDVVYQSSSSGREEVKTLGRKSSSLGPTITDIPEDALQATYQDKHLSLEETREVILAQQKTLSSLEMRKPRLSDDPAEVVVIITSLRGGVTSYFSSIRLMHLMNCKRVLWVSIDTNKDVIVGRALANSELLKLWHKEEIVALNADNKVAVPQCLIDGVSVGDATDVFALEEDGDLDHIINRDRCPKCLEDRDRDVDECLSCGVQFRTLVPDELGAAQKVVYTIGFEEVPWDTNPKDHPLSGLPHIGFTPLEDVTSAVTF